MEFEVIQQLQGQTLTNVERIGDRELKFYTNDKVIRMYHPQECCEDVSIEDLVGDLDDLVGNPILRAEERTKDGTNGWGDERWTFYEIATIKGSVTIRWYGSSNGYYGISVNIYENDLD